jgi:hypothetical protein
MNQKRKPGVTVTFVLPELAPSRKVWPKNSRNVVRFPKSFVDGVVHVSANDTS